MTSAPTKRYFYSDPLAVAWMAKHFGMRFILLDKGLEFSIDGWEATCQEALQGGLDSAKFLILPDSLPLLEPRAGDMVTNIGMSGWRVTGFEDERVFCAHDFYGKKSELSIILREGKPFHWPESEEV